MARRLGHEGRVGTGLGHVEVRAHDELQLPQVGAQDRDCFLGGGFPEVESAHHQAVASQPVRSRIGETSRRPSRTGADRMCAQPGSPAASARG